MFILFTVYRILDFKMYNLILARAALNLLKGRVVGTAGIKQWPAAIFTRPAAVLVG
jgi:hypothetical protein